MEWNLHFLEITIWLVANKLFLKNIPHKKVNLHMAHFDFKISPLRQLCITIWLNCCAYNMLVPTTKKTLKNQAKCEKMHFSSRKRRSSLRSIALENSVEKSANDETSHARKKNRVKSTSLSSIFLRASRMSTESLLR